MSNTVCDVQPSSWERHSPYPGSPEKGCWTGTQGTSWRASTQGMLAFWFDVADSPQVSLMGNVKVKLVLKWSLYSVFKVGSSNSSH